MRANGSHDDRNQGFTEEWIQTTPMKATEASRIKPLNSAKTASISKSWNHELCMFIGGCVRAGFFVIRWLHSCPVIPNNPAQSALASMSSHTASR